MLLRAVSGFAILAGMVAMAINVILTLCKSPCSETPPEGQPGTADAQEVGL